MRSRFLYFIDLDCSHCCCRTRSARGGFHFIRNGHGDNLLHKGIHTPTSAGAIPCFAFLLGKRRGLFFVPPAEVGFLSVNGSLEGRDFGGDFGPAGSAVLVDSAAGRTKIFGIAALEGGFEGLGGAGDEGHI